MTTCGKQRRYIMKVERLYIANTQLDSANTDILCCKDRNFDVAKIKCVFCKCGASGNMPAGAFFPA